MLRFILTMAACLFAGALPAIVPAALGQTQAPPTPNDTPPVDGPKPIAYDLRPADRMSPSER